MPARDQTLKPSETGTQPHDVSFSTTPNVSGVQTPGPSDDDQNDDREPDPRGIVGFNLSTQDDKDITPVVEDSADDDLFDSVLGHE